MYSMPSNLEKRIRDTGLWLYELVEGELPSVFKKDYWLGKVLEWCMKDEAFKVEMFRFIDVFPYLTTSESIARHLQEYFLRPEMHFPAVLQWGLNLVSPSSLPAKMVARSIAGNVASMAEQFIVGSNPREALRKLEKLRSRGMAFSVDLLGEEVVSEKEAEEYLQRYIELLDTLNEAQLSWPALGDGTGGLDWGNSPRINISIKTTAMYSQMSNQAFDYSIRRAKERLRPILRKAMDIGAFVYLDMEQYGIKNLTLALYRSLMEEPEFRDFPHTGIVIQAYLHESEADLRGVLQWARKRGIRFTIRLVKGAYWDSEIIWARQENWPLPVFTNKHETDANFEKLARIIMEHHQWARLACGSHNMRSIAYVMETAKDMRLSTDDLEYQVLYGMGEPVRNALRKAGLPLRIYTPIGEMIQGMSYLVRRLLENTANESFLRQSFAQNVAREELLRSPLELIEKEAPTFEASIGSEAQRAPGAFKASEAVKAPKAPASPVTAPQYGDKGPFTNEPHFDWSHAEHRKLFGEALERMRESFPIDVPLIIGGKRLRTGTVIHSTNPNKPAEIVGIVASADREVAEKAVRAAVSAFPAWRDTPPRERAEYLFRAAAAARRMRYELAALQVFEVGKAWSEADGDVCEAIDFLEYYGREMIRLGAPVSVGSVPGEESHLVYEPRGVVVVVAPWNFPLAISMGMTSAALATGSTVIYKPASQSPVVGSMVYRLFEKAGLPAGALHFVPGPGTEVGEYLVSHPDVALIAFTGSRDVGLRILRLAAEVPPGSPVIKKVVAEMGGKNAVIVDEDADLDEVVRHVIISAFGYQGQKCSACSRLIVLEDIHDKLVERLMAAAESLHMGPVEDPRSFMGAVIEPSAKEKILKYIEIGKKEGELLLERHPPESEESWGHTVPLAIFGAIRPEHRLAREEIFGPILAVMKVKDFDEALQVANSTVYGLTGSVFSRSPANIEKARKEFRTGNLYINRGCTGAVVGRHPFGGVKMSGIGSKAGGPDYLLQFMTARTIAENTIRRGFAPSVPD